MRVPGCCKPQQIRVLQEENDVTKLRQYLASRSDAPGGAFGSSFGIDISSGNQNNFNSIVNGKNEDLFQDDMEKYEYIPTDFDDIENFASSYDPSEFMDEYTNNGKDDASSTYESNFTLAIHSNASMVNNVEKIDENIMKPTLGALDNFFLQEVDNLSDTVNREIRAELTVQETVAVILRASAIKRRTKLSNLWLQSTQILLNRMKQENVEDGNSTGINMSSFLLSEDEIKNVNGPSTQYESMDIEELKSICNKLGKDLSDVSKVVVELDASARRMGKRLLDFSSLGSTRDSKQEALEKELDEVIANLPSYVRQPDSPGDDGEYVFGSDSYDEQFNPMLGGKRGPNTLLEMNSQISEQKDRSSYEDDFAFSSDNNDIQFNPMESGYNTKDDEIDEDLSSSLPDIYPSDYTQGEGDGIFIGDGLPEQRNTIFESRGLKEEQFYSAEVEDMDNYLVDLLGNMY